MKNPMTNPSFVRWFRDSKLVDKNGVPRVFYHGTGQSFVSFDNEKSPKGIDKNLKGVSWFSSAPEVAGEFAGHPWEEVRSGVRMKGRPVIMPVYLRVENPYVDLHGELALGGGLTREVARDLERQGYDGVIVPESPLDLPDTTSDTGGYYVNRHGIAWGESEEVPYPDQVAVFNSTQIKSAIGNKGTYDSNSSIVTESFSQKLLEVCASVMDLSEAEEVITFPKREHEDVKGLLRQGGTVTTVRLCKDCGRFKPGEVYLTEWGDAVEILSVQRFHDPRKIPTWGKMDRIMHRSIENGMKYGGNQMDWVALRLKEEE